MKDLTNTEREALDLLPYPLATAAVKTAAQNKGALHEIRLRLGQYLAVTSFGRNLKCNIRCTREDIDFVIRRLCGNSLYSHADTIREGYISGPCGIRAGVCGRAVMGGDVINAVTDITSVSIRVPHRVRGAADSAYELLRERDFSCGMLIYSKPGIGKTTRLRELAVRLASGDRAHRVAVVDTRCEIMAGVEESLMADVLYSYPREKGIEIAMRTLSPEFIICDEISKPSDAAAVLSAIGSGVRMIASSHAESFGELMSHSFIRELDERNAFGIYYGLLGRSEAAGSYVTDTYFSESVSQCETEVR
ncbi:MAG: hypothetical protein IKM46_01915 [Clostridia bacterium]|nr:hypothetical protein [Clostridia bacterium]